MKLAALLHNPGAGDEDHSIEELINLIQNSLQLECRYFSTKEEGWEEFEPGTDLLIVAGGDGTVRKVARALLNRKQIDKKLPIALLPFGTANNIAKALHIQGNSEEVIQRWRREHFIKFDAGRIEGIRGQKFLIEGFGYGVFPALIDAMKKPDKLLKTKPQRKMRLAIELLEEVALAQQPFYCSVDLDGMDMSGNFLMVEVMNIASIGPNLVLAPDADPADGLLDVMLIREQDRQQLLDYINNKRLGNDNQLQLPAYRAKHIHLHCEEHLIHVDDELIKLKESCPVRIEMQSGMLEFMI
jgi:Sphingosine kinase and enzymes related to eukaryotic diacylglycerol kinase